MSPESRAALEVNRNAHRELFTSGQLSEYGGKIVIMKDGALLDIVDPWIKPAEIGRFYSRENPGAHIMVVGVEGNPESPAYFVS